jgi:hypothetical protein
MREPPFTVGVEVKTSFLFQNVALLLRASVTGSPSVPADAGYLSTSSQSTTRMGLDASDAGLFAPQIVRWPPGKLLCNNVLPLSRLRASLILPRSAGVSRNIGARRSFDHASPSSSVGISTKTGAGSCATWNPMTLFTISVLPTWALDITTTVSMRGSLIASMIPRWYSARDVIQTPGSALASGLRRRNWSAHSLTVSLGGAFSAA